ncbi:Metallo-dependent phosphatase-like protein [Mycotypha africana]|uniref:Metallo-dependent phosphatase-like protein n=1 Tax=Mycotypha africana TaxID=64632 RepID=UPI002301F25C|nr:Metallo-dependent phosphatase-like protein [Mycotypha africana]KAI8973697.1 Metallo-dependent phosphatase-like protein [Mycotypha africana]
MFDRGYVACGVLRKQPMLYVQDTHHVQVVWEMNCGMSNKDMILSYWPESSQSNSNTEKITIGPIKPKVIDSFHTLYRATIGPLIHTGPVHYTIDIVKKDRQKEGNNDDGISSWNVLSKKRKTIAKYTFHWFADAKEKQEEPIRIAAMADNQFGLLTFSAILRQIRKLPQRKQPHFLLHAGDAVQNYPSLRQWQTDFAAPLTAHNLIQRMPLIYAHGNHDYDPTGEYIYTRSQAADPWFSFSLGNNTARFIILDSNLDWERQDQWLKDEIKSDLFKAAQFRIVVVHVPPFLEYWEPEAWFKLRQSEWGAFIKDRFVPLFEEGGVDLVISGHQHNYERGERNGISYAIIGGAGGDIDYEQVKDWGMYEAKLLDFHFVVLEFIPPAKTESGKMDSWSLHWEMFDVNGQKIDSTVLIAKQQASTASPLEQATIDKTENILQAIAEGNTNQPL